MFEPEVFRKQMRCVEGSACDIDGIFRPRRQWFGAPGKLYSLRVTPKTVQHLVETLLSNLRRGQHR